MGTMARCEGVAWPGKKLWQLLVPEDWCQCVLWAVHGSVWAGHCEEAKTLNKLQFYETSCMRDTEHFVHCCDPCTDK